jgi:hypothetical protein
VAFSWYGTVRYVGGLFRRNAQVWHNESCMTEQQTKTKENLYQADPIGSGTFIIHKPKRKPAKLRQSRLKAPRGGARK